MVNKHLKILGLYQVSSGKAYVKGYEVNKQNTEFVDFFKPRTTKTLENQRVNIILEHL